MNKYQKDVFELISFRLLVVRNEKDRFSGDVKKENDKIVIYQDKDIAIKDYHLVINDTDISLLKLSYYSNKKWNGFSPYKYKENYLAATFNFDNPITKIKIENTLGLFEPFEVEVQNQLASVDEYNKRVAEAKAKKDAEKQAKIDELIKADYKVGDNLVNLYWNLVNDKVKKTKVELYLADGFDFNRYQVNKEVVDESTGKKANKWVTEIKITKTGQYRKVASYEIEEGATFKSISGLAYGTYAYEITELDAKGNKIASTGKVLFKLIAQSGRNEVIFGR